MSTLIKYEAARQALVEAATVDEVLQIRNAAEHATLYAKQAKDTELIERATEIRLRAERRCGEMLRESAKNGDRETRGGDRRSTSKSSAPTLKDIGLTRDESSRFQKLAAISEGQFEETVATAKAVAGEVTAAFVLKQTQAARERNAAVVADDEEVEPTIQPDRPVSEYEEACRFYMAIEAIARLRYPVAVLRRALPDYQHYHVTNNVDAAITTLREVQATWKKNAA